MISLLIRATAFQAAYQVCHLFRGVLCRHVGVSNVENEGDIVVLPAAACKKQPALFRISEGCRLLFRLGRDGVIRLFHNIQTAHFDFARVVEAVNIHLAGNADFGLRRYFLTAPHVGIDFHFDGVGVVFEEIFFRV